MKPRPTAVAFDVLETVFSLESLRPRVTATGLPGEALEAWFARILRDGFALEVTATYEPFRRVATAALAGLLAERGLPGDPAVLESVIDGFAELDAHPDAPAAFQRLSEGRVRVLALTNGSAEATTKLLRRARLDPFVERVISIDEVQHWKPRNAVYHHAAARAGLEPSQLALVATHPWDIHGAGKAGLITAYVSRGKPYPAFMVAPRVTAPTLPETAEALMRLEESGAV